uniref:Solute carrier family 38 member 8 n=1 Tax=Apteryx owenii TaxID=8824 RepID=A0A8B9PUJ6_APTOW
QGSLVFLVSGLAVLGYASSLSTQSTYQGVVREVCGTAVGKLCEVCFILNLFMISVAFLRVVGDQLEKCESPHGEEPSLQHWYADQRFTLSALCVLVIFPLSVPKEIGFQKYSRYPGRGSSTWPRQPGAELRASSWASMFSVIPTICFGFQVTLPAHRPSWAMGQVAGAAGAQGRCLQLPWGLYGYLTFGEDVAADILMSYPGNDAVVIVARLLFGISIVTIYPIVVLLGRSVVRDMWVNPKRGAVPVAEAHEQRTRVVLTVSWIAATLAIALFVPDIGKVIGLIGGISAFFIFIFPGLAGLTAAGRSPRRAALLTWGILSVLCGAFVCGQSTAGAAMELLHRA